MPSAANRSHLSWCAVNVFVALVYIFCIFGPTSHEPCNNECALRNNKIVRNHSVPATFVTSRLKVRANEFAERFNKLQPPKDFAHLDIPTRDGSRNWRWAVVAFIAYHVEFYSTTGWQVYQFGVAGGASLSTIRNAFAFYRLWKPVMWGFDSFQGIPSEATGVKRPAGWVSGTYDSSREHPHSGWSCKKGRGSINAGGVTCVGDPASKRVTYDEQVRFMMDKYKFVESNVHFVPGFYNESLSDTLLMRKELRPAMYVDIDCDLYVSTYQALDFLFAHGLAVVGTLIGYDDFCLTDLGTAGESRAHIEISKKYQVTFVCVVGGCSDAMMSTGKKRYYNMRSSKMMNPVFLVVAKGSDIKSGMEAGYPTKCVSQSKVWLQTLQEE